MKVFPRPQRMQRADCEEGQCLKDQEVVIGTELVQLDAEALKDARLALGAREEQLAVAAFELDRKEARLTAGIAACHEDATALAAAQWAALAAERQVLAGRWACLAEDKKALAAAERRALRDTDDPQPFEPGSLPIQDVRCAIIAHQVDIPCSSCCFQR